MSFFKKIVMLFLLFPCVVLAVEPPADLADYQVVDGDYFVEWGEQKGVSPGIYVKGDVSISPFGSFTGNIYATGNIGVSYFGEINGDAYSESNIDKYFGANITGGEYELLPVLASYCLSPPDVSDYELHEGNYQLAQNTRFPETERQNLYITGGALLLVDSDFHGDIYAVGDVELKNKAIVHGSVYSENGVVLKGSKSEITGEVCEYGPALPAPEPPTIDLPIDELIGQCTEIFKDAAQSFSSSGELFMQNNTQILNSNSNVLSFDKIAGYYYPANQPGGQPPPDSCGNGVQCTVDPLGVPSAELTSFGIPEITGDDVYIYNPSDNTTFGGTGTGQGSGTVFGTIQVNNGTTATFLPQDYDSGEMYYINDLKVYGGTLKLNAGVYAINQLTINNNSSIEIIGGGDVFIFVESSAGDLSFDMTKQDESSQFFYISNSNTSFQASSANVINGYFYSTGDITLGSNVDIKGKVAASNLTLEGNNNSAASSITSDVMCGVPPRDDYYFEIVTLPDALTCEPHSVLINVKYSFDNSLFTDYAGEIALVSDPALGTWSLTSGLGTLTDSGLANGQASYQFASITNSDQGTVTLGLSNYTAGDLIVSVSDDIGTPDSTDITFHTSLIKTKLSCIDTINGYCINTANIPFSLTLSAVKENEESTLCESYEPSGIAFWSEYVMPTSTVAAGTAVEIELEKIGKTDGTAKELDITFVDGVVIVAANYPDAGEINIHVKDSDSDNVFGQATLIVTPLELQIDQVSNNPAESNDYNPITGDGFKRAAVRSHSSLVDVDSFNITVKAVIDCSNDTANNCSGSSNPKAPSFSNEITLLPRLVFPTGASASLGTVHSEAGSNELSAMMSAGELTYSDLSYDEVGVLGLQATSINYIQDSNDITASEVKEIGRFYPAYIAYDNYSYDSGCNDFTYMTEGMDTDVPTAQSAVSVNYVMQAKAQASTGATEKTTTNYHYALTGGYPVAATDHFSDRAYSKNGLTDLSARILPTSYYDESEWESGIYTVTGLAMGLQKSTSSVDGPYFLEMPSDSTINDQVEYYIGLVGIDGEKLQTDINNDCGSDMCRLPADDNLSSFGDFAYGRLQAGNGHGSEFQPIHSLIEATYFDGRQFAPFTRDTCTPIVNQQLSATPTMSPINEIIVGSGKSKLVIQNSPLISGKSYFEFSAPDSRGKLDYFVRLKDLSNVTLYAPWLLDSGNAVTCPSETGSLKDCISGYVEFGLFRGNDRVIYRMQTFE